MQKVYVSADVEGLNGITSFKQVLPEFTADYAQMRPQLHLELNALIRGLKAAGVQEIVVNDAHNTMTNITLSELPSDIKLISGKPKKVSMMYGLNESYDGVILFAYHSKATSDGVLAHTFNMYFKSVWINDEKVSEAQLNAICAKIFNVPVIMASGDNVFCEEIKKDIGNIETIETKKAICGTAAICRINDELLAEYEQKASKIDKLPKIHYQTQDEYELKVEFESSSIAKEIAEKLNIKKEDAFVKFTSSDFIEIYVMLQKISAQMTIVSQRSQTQQV